MPSASARKHGVVPRATFASAIPWIAVGMENAWEALAAASLAGEAEDATRRFAPQIAVDMVSATKKDLANATMVGAARTAQPRRTIVLALDSLERGYAVGMVRAKFSRTPKLSTVVPKALAYAKTAGLAETAIRKGASVALDCQVSQLTTAVAMVFATRTTEPTRATVTTVSAVVPVANASAFLPATTVSALKEYVNATMAGLDATALFLFVPTNVMRRTAGGNASMPQEMLVPLDFGATVRSVSPERAANAIPAHRTVAVDMDAATRISKLAFASWDGAMLHARSTTARTTALDVASATGRTRNASARRAGVVRRATSTCARTCAVATEFVIW